MDGEVINELLECCRRELQITWDDKDTDKRIINHIKSGALTIERDCGVTDIDFKEGGKANALLLAYVRRSYSGDISTFKADYIGDIIALQTDKEVDEYGNE